MILNFELFPFDSQSYPIKSQPLYFPTTRNPSFQCIPTNFTGIYYKLFILMVYVGYQYIQVFKLISLNHHYFP